MFSTSLSRLFSTSSLTRSMLIRASRFLTHSLLILSRVGIQNSIFGQNFKNLSGLSVSAMACSSSDLVSFNRPFSLQKIVVFTTCPLLLHLATTESNSAIFDKTQLSGISENGFEIFFHGTKMASLPVLQNSKYNHPNLIKDL